MKPDPFAHLPRMMTMLLPFIKKAVLDAAYGEPLLRKTRLDRAISHAERLLTELKSARLLLEKDQRKGDAA